MKTLLRHFLVNVVALWAVAQLFSGMTFAKNYETLVVTAAVLGLVHLLVKPILNIFLLPLNLLTLGMFRWLVNVASLYLVTLLVSGFSVYAFNFSGFSYSGFYLPAFAVSGFMALVLTSFVLSLISSFFYWLCK
jgi:putative membrane protein